VDAPISLAGQRFDSARHAEVRAPWDGALLGRVSLADAAAAAEAVRLATEAFPTTSRLPGYQRAALCAAVSRALELRREEFAELIAREVAKPIALARAEVDRAVQTFRLGAEEATRVAGEMLPLDQTPAGATVGAITRRVAISPVLAITPFNFPINLVAHKLSPAFAVGAPVVLKPAPQAPLTAALLAQVVAEACAGAGVPGAMLSVVPCEVDVAETLVRDPRLAVLSFTGSAPVGWHLREIAPRKRAVLELGGNAALIVAADADLDRALDRAIAGGYGYAGQVCIKAQRLFLHEAIAEEFTARLCERVAALSVRDPLDPQALCSALIDRRAADRVRGWIDEAVAAGARVLVGGAQEASRIAPAVIADATPGMKLCDEELFGPAVTLHPWRDPDAMIDAVNASRHGLQAGLFTRDITLVSRAFQRLEVGAVVLDEGPTFRVDSMPYGGVKDSGQGREGVRWSIAEMTDLRTLVWRGLLG
jgi:acyl-CoA reductase-like NAD-dependent aldehyde dehydrogenase